MAETLVLCIITMLHLKVYKHTYIHLKIQPPLHQAIPNLFTEVLRSNYII